MNNKTKKIFLQQEGNAIITTPIIIAIGIMIVSSLIVLSVNIITPYVWYEKLSSTCIKYIYIMEEFGYLTKDEVNNLKSELKKQGFNEEELFIGYTSTRVDYGSPIFLEIKYNYKTEIPFEGVIEVPMIITRNSVSKR